jgi:predicted  nucleic acid-binding Zn-ribbon protein
MATLEDAAEELANTLKELDHELEESQQSLLSFGEKLVSDTQRIEDGWTSLAERVDAFLQHLPELARRMDDGVQ